MTPFPVRPLVSVVVVNYNGARHLETCFEALAATRYPVDRLELIMVDGGSTDGSLELMAERFPAVKVLTAATNNYCLANNLGIAQARGAYVALLNNDTRVDPGWLEPLVELLERRPDAGAAGSKILSMDGRRICSVGHTTLPQYYWADRGYNEPDEGQYDHVDEVASLSGAAVVYRRTCLDQVGMLDEDFVMFVEDVDLGYRCRAKRWKLFVVPDSRVHHLMHGSVSEEEVHRWSERNRLLFVAKHHPERLPMAWQSQGRFRPDTAPHVDGRGSEVLAASVAKLIREHGLQRAAAILPALFAALEEVFNADRTHWVQALLAQRAGLETQFTSLREQLGAAQAAIEERDRELVERDRLGAKQARAIERLEGERRFAQSQAGGLRLELAGIDRSVRRLLVVKAQHAPLVEVEAWLRDFRLRRPEAQIGLFAHVLPEEFDRLSSSDAVDEPWLFCPGRRPFSWWALMRLLPRLWMRRYDLVVIPLREERGYTGFTRARQVAWLTGAKRRRVLSLTCHDAPRFSEVVTYSSLAIVGRVSEYAVGVTNPSPRHERVRFQMAVSRLLDDPNQQNEISQLVTTFEVPPRMTKPLTVRYDWVGESVVMVNGMANPLEVFRQVAVPETTIYRVRLTLADYCDRPLDTCDLFQRIVEAE